MSSKKVLILCYSGSGNTKKMAKAIAEAMKSSVIDVAVEDAGKFDISSLPNYDAIVLGSPTYFSNVAWQIKKVIDESINHLGSKISFVIGNSNNPKTDDYFVNDAMEELWHLAIYPLLIEKLNRNLKIGQLTRIESNLSEMLVNEGEFLSKAFALIS